MKESIIFAKSKAFAVRIVRMYQWLNSVKKEYILSKQCMRSGTSIGANVMEAINAQSIPEFIAKLQTSLKEANETVYWLDLLRETDYIEQEMYDSMRGECMELVKMLTSIIKSTKTNNNIKL